MKRNGADIMWVLTDKDLDVLVTPLTKPIFDHYVSIPNADGSGRTSYHVRTNISKHDLSTKRFFKTADQTYTFIRTKGHPITSCSTTGGCPGRIS